MKTAQDLYLLLQTQGTIPEATLCEQLSLSPDQLAKELEQLATQGITIETFSDGYRIASGDLLVPEWISQQIKLPVHFNEQSISTQRDAKENLAQAAPALYLAPTQTDARGRFGRHFFTSQTGIYMSLHLRQDTTLAHDTAYTLMAAAAIYKAIARLTGIQTDIKWVNDIYLKGRKIAGILTERFLDSNDPTTTHLIIGIGINFAIDTFPETLKHKAGSLFVGQPPITRNQLIALIWQLFLETPEADLIKVYKDRSLVLDQWVSFDENGTSYQGLVTDITDKGELCLQLADGSYKTLSSGDISLTTWTTDQTTNL